MAYSIVLTYSTCRYEDAKLNSILTAIEEGSNLISTPSSPESYFLVVGVATNRIPDESMCPVEKRIALKYVTVQNLTQY